MHSTIKQLYAFMDLKVSEKFAVLLCQGICCLMQGCRNNRRGGVGRNLVKGTCNDYDAIVTSEFKLKGYFLQTYTPNHCCISWQVVNS